jgi:hypothetical protein
MNRIVPDPQALRVWLLLTIVGAILAVVGWIRFLS